MKEIISSGTVSYLDIGLVGMRLKIEGLPLSKSSGTQLWPILGVLQEPYQSVPIGNALETVTCVHSGTSEQQEICVHRVS